MTINKIIPVDIYNTDMMIHFGGVDELKRALQEYEGCEEIIKGLNALVAGRTFFNKENGTVLIFLPEIPKTSEQYATLSHELLHATHFMLKKAGVSYCNKSEEAFAYLLGFLTKKVLDAIFSCQSP